MILADGPRNSWRPGGRSHVDNRRVVSHLAAVVAGYRLAHRPGEVRDEVRRQVRGLGGVGGVAHLVVEEDKHPPMRNGVASDKAPLGRYPDRARQQARDGVLECYHSHCGLDHQDDRDRNKDYGNPGMRQATWDAASESSRQQITHPFQTGLHGFGHRWSSSSRMNAASTLYDLVRAVLE